MNKDTNKKLTSFSAHLDEQYGEKGTPERDRFDEGFDAFKLGAMIDELPKEQGSRMSNPPAER